MDMFRVAVFTVSVIAVYVMAPAILVRWFRSRGGEHLLGRKLDLFVIALAVIGVGCAIDAVREPYKPEVTRVEVRLAKMSPGARVRIVQISDVHSGERARLEERLPDIIAAEHPDVIAFTGDAVNGPQGIPVFRKLMTRLTAIAPVYAIRGNWDVDPRHRGVFDATGVRVLEGNAVMLEIRGQRLAFIGDRYHGAVANRKMKALSDLDPDTPSIVLVHSPDLIDEAPTAGLVLAGHTHGGQIRMPLYGALITLSRYGKKYEAGLYKVNDTWMYVSRGIGMELNAPVRFLCRPEVVVIDIAGK